MGLLPFDWSLGSPYRPSLIGTTELSRRWQEAAVLRLILSQPMLGLLRSFAEAILVYNPHGPEADTHVPALARITRRNRNEK
jgi:hypothetical protein